MSERNGDRARFQKNRKHRLALRQRQRALLSKIREKGLVSAPVEPLPPAPAK